MTSPTRPSPSNTPNRQRRPPVNPALQAANIPQQATVIKELSTASVLATCLSKTMGMTLHSGAFKAYLDDVLAAARSTQDPVERMLIEQLVLAHHRIGELHAQSAVAETPQVIETFNAAASRLMAEFRKMTLALREYRSPTAAPNITVVKQQNVAAGDQQIALVDGAGHGQTPEKNILRNELTSNTPPAITHDHSINLIPQSATRGGWQAEPVTAGTDYCGGTPPLAEINAVAQTVAPIHWPQDPGR